LVGDNSNLNSKSRQHHFRLDAGTSSKILVAFNREENREDTEGPGFVV
jgi:hypothetical protein